MDRIFCYECDAFFDITPQNSYYDFFSDQDGGGTFYTETWEGGICPTCGKAVYEHTIEHDYKDED